MKKNLLVVFLLAGTLCLQAQNPGKHQLRIVDTLTPLERNTRNPVLLQSEVDSIIHAYLAQQPPAEPVVMPQPIVKKEIPAGVWIVAGATLALVVTVLLVVFRKQNKTSRQLRDLVAEVRSQANGKTAGRENTAGGIAAAGSKANVNVQARLDAFEALKQEMMATYKIRNYPGYDRTRSEEELLVDLVKTERSFAEYAYNHFLKPVFVITDANKNHPARMRKEEALEAANLLLSLALFYSEYLFLRSGELAIGGKMVARMQGVRANVPLDEELLKKLNREHGSRALVMRMILDKLGVSELSYPVFDETNLNQS